MIIFIFAIFGMLLVFAGLRIVFTKHPVYTGTHPEQMKIIIPIKMLFANAGTILVIPPDQNVLALPKGYTLSEKEKKWFGGGFVLVGLGLFVIAQLFL